MAEGKSYEVTIKEIGGEVEEEDIEEIMKQVEEEINKGKKWLNTKEKKTV